MRFAGDFSFQCPLKINCGSHALTGLPTELVGRGAGLPLILTNRRQVGTRPFQSVVDAFRSSGMTLAIYDQLPDHPDPDLFSRLLTLFRDGGCDSLIAVGCGSVVDIAKCLNMRAAAYRRVKRPGNAPHFHDEGALCPLFWVATPGGDGNEATQYANDGSGLLAAARLMPDVALIDPVMMEGGQHAVVNGGLIGLAHAVEAFLDDSAGFLTHAHAHAAISLIMCHLALAIDRADSAVSLSGVVCGQVIAGCAYSVSSPGVCHMLAIRLGVHTDLPTGYLMAMLLPHVVAEAGHAHPDRVGRLLYPLAGADEWALTAGDLRAPRAAARLWEFFDAMSEKLTLGIPTALKHAGLTEEPLRQVQDGLRAEGDRDFLATILARAACDLPEAVAPHD